MSKRSRDYFESFENYQRLCEEYEICSPPSHKKFKTNTNNCSKNNSNTNSNKPQISITIRKSLQIKLNNSSFDDNKKIAKETINIISNGHYKADNKLIQIRQAHNNAFKNTILYHSNNKYKFCELKQENKYDKMDIEIINETTLNGCYAFFNDANITNPIALNFASAQLPGGSFKNGSRAQEESLCRCSGLYGTLIKYKNEFYKYHKNINDNKMLYSDSIIYSPNVVIFRDHNNNLMNNYYLCSFVSSPAVNCKEFMKRNNKNKHNKNILETMVYNTMKKRIDKIFDIAVKHRHDAIILGAFGCGKFGNDINSIADIFAMLLATKYKYCFKKVRFSCLQTGKNCYVIQTFEHCIKKWFKINH